MIDFVSTHLAAPLLSLAALLALFIAMWLWSLRSRDAGAVDIIWGPGFAVVAWVGWAWLAPRHEASALVLVAVTLWAARLGLHLFARHRRSTAEDARYAAMRAADPDGFPARSLKTVFVLQAVILWALALPIHLAMAAGPGQMGGLSVAGTLLFAAGFVLEAVADWKLLRFRSDPANAGGLLTDGPFAWSRHPNYFGEAVLWFGVGLMAWDASGNPLALLGPAALTALLLKVSGIPLLEAHLAATRPGFADYKARTSAFIPWPPRRTG
jgi:steroid 5-alpha reductase family enzyme